MNETYKGEESPKIQRMRLDKILIFEVTDLELEQLENSSDNSLNLNFSIFLLSTAFSFLTTLLTATLANMLFIVFFCITSIGLILGSFLLILWYKNRKKDKKIFDKIRNRTPIFMY